MMAGTRPIVFLVVLGGLAVLAGCASSSPEMSDADSAFEEGDYEAALVNIEQVVSKDTVSADAYLFKAEILRRLADSTLEPEPYADLFRRAYAAEEEALSVSQRVREKVTERRHRIYDEEMGRGERAYNRANKNEDEELYRRAAAFFGAAASTQPDSARPVVNEAYARLQLGQRKEVIPVLERYTERADTANKDAYKILGQIYVSSGQHQKAIFMLDEAVQVHPEDHDLHALRLDAFNKAGNVDEALLAYREEVEKAPNKATYRYNYGALLLKANRYDEAIPQLSRAVELRPDDAEGQYNLGTAYLNAALARDDSIAAFKERAATDSTEAPEQEIERLTERRQALFAKAVPPLERARKLAEGERSVRRDACRALLVAYVQTDRPTQAAQVEECTDLARAPR